MKKCKLDPEECNLMEFRELTISPQPRVSSRTVLYCSTLRFLSLFKTTSGSQAVIETKTFPQLASDLFYLPPKNIGLDRRLHISESQITSW